MLHIVRFLSAALLISVIGGPQEPSSYASGPSLNTHARNPNEVTSVEDLVKQLERCGELSEGSFERQGIVQKRSDTNQDETANDSDGCVFVIYVWSPVMPLSGVGVENITAAVEDLAVPLSLVAGEALWNWLGDPTAYSKTRGGGAERVLASEMIRAGATVHYPAILIYDGSAFVGPAIIGFKTADAYREMIAERLNRGVGPQSPTRETGRVLDPNVPPVSARGDYRDIEVGGHPGAYFRYIPGGGGVGFESGGENYILDLDSGTYYWAPGIVDLVPSPDGLFLVTPRARRGGLEFHDTAYAFAQRTPTTMSQSPVFTPLYVDLEMKDQYPSVGILEQKAQLADYRVLTSWRDGIIHRDYEVRHSSPDGRAEVRPLGEPVQTCPGYKLSTPIIAKNGREVAARDEATGTTKVFRINDDMSCEEVLDVGMQTGKVAWDSTGRRIAFAIPRGVARDANGNVRNLHGVFVLDRENLTLMRIPGSDEMDRLTFPEFVEDTAVIFLVRGKVNSGEQDRFRLFCCLN